MSSDERISFRDLSKRMRDALNEAPDVPRDDDPEVEATRRAILDSAKAKRPQVRCDECRFFRPNGSSARRLGIALFGRETRRAVARLRDRESAASDEETAEVRIARLQVGDGPRTAHASPAPSDVAWASRPFVSAYCGLREVDHHVPVYLFAERKNQDRDCGDFSPEQRASHCHTCRWRRPPRGPVDSYEHKRDLMAYDPPGGFMTPHGFERSEFRERVAELNERRDEEAASEIADATDSGGFVFSEPRWLDHCAYFSERGQGYGVCAFLNSDSRCTAYEDGHAVQDAYGFTHGYGRVRRR